MAVVAENGETHRPAAPATAQDALPAAGSSFYTAMRILPREQREAMYAVYAFCRAVDDIADGDAPHPDRLAALERWREDIARLYQGKPTQAAAFLVEPVRRFGLLERDFNAVIDGMAMDAAADIRAPDWATLALYCDRVASAVGRLSIRIFGLEPAVGGELAHHLGRALQLTNILRDIDEDAAIGRLYLPREGLQAAGIEPTLPPAEALAKPGLAAVAAEVATRAEGHFREAERIMAECPRRAVRAPRLMAAAYRQILERLTKRGWAAPRGKVRIGKLRLVGAALRYGLF